MNCHALTMPSHETALLMSVYCSTLIKSPDAKRQSMLLTSIFLHLPKTASLELKKIPKNNLAALESDDR